MLLSCAVLCAAQTDSLADYQWALRANLARWATLTPALGAEYRFHPRWAVTADYTWGNYTLRGGDRRYALSEVSGEVRHYLGRQRRLYAGLYAVGGQFNYKLSATGRQGDHWGVGLSAGYQLPLSGRWLLDVGGALGWLTVQRGERYKYQDALEVWREDFSRSGLAPLALRATLAYTFPRRRRAVLSPDPPATVGQPDTAAVALPVVESASVPVPVPETAVVTRKPEPERVCQLRTRNPVLEHISHYRPYTKDRVLRKEQGALYVHFPVGSSVLQPGFRDNRQTLERIVSATRQMMDEPDGRVCIIQIVGLASIEGRTAFNQQLAQARAEALKRYIQQHVDTPDSLYEVNCGGEAWSELRDQLCDALAAGDDTHGLQQVLDIIDHEPDADRRKQRLRQLNGGRTYRYIRDRLLGEQRNSGYLRIYYDWKE